jgi:hypothetical protein
MAVSALRKKELQGAQVETHHRAPSHQIVETSTLDTGVL